MSSLPDDDRRALLDEFAPESFFHEWWYWARQNQLTPPGDWRLWLILAGRGFGKTRTGVEWVRDEVERGRLGRLGLIAPTAADVRDVMVEGESGIMATARPSFRPVYEPSKRRLTWPNGAQAALYSAEEPDRLRGPQHDGLLTDEVAAWKYPETWDMAMFGLRLGSNPRTVAMTTPRPTPFIRGLIQAPHTYVTVGTTYDNIDNLPPAFVEQIIRKYEGTRRGRQELLAEILTDVPGALWTYAMLEDRRPAPDLTRVVVAIDPAVTSGEDSDETGIVVAGLGVDGRGYLLADRSCRLSPDGWARRAVAAFDDYRADLVVAEVNNGGDMVESTIRTVRKTISYKKIHASRGKQTRAQPVAALYEQGRVSHVEVFADLEEQLCVAQGTMVLTIAGECPIEDVRAGDAVWTRSGWMPVEWSGQTGVSGVFVEIEASNGGWLRCTPTHPVWVDGRGFIPAIEVQPGCIIHTCQYRSPENMSIISASSTSGNASRMGGSTTALPEEAPARGASSTWSSTPSIMAPFRPAGTSITEIGTASTTIRRICSDVLDKTISENTADHGAPRMIRVNCGVIGGNPSGSVVSLVPSRVPVAAWLSSPLASEQHSAPARVNDTTVHYGALEPVYNLTVFGCPEYIAGGILTHNCTWTPESGSSPDRLDALVWALTELMVDGTGPAEFY